MPLNKYVLYILIFFLSISSYSQEKFTISGTISDAKNNETLIGVNILVKGTKTFTSTNEYGFYSITLPKGDYELNISYVSYTIIDEKISLTEDIKKNYSLSESENVIEEVIITEKTKTNEAADGKKIYINVGLFAKESNARNAHDKLTKAGLPAKEQQVTGSKGTFTRVRVGPYKTLAQAEKAAEKIKSQGLEAVVVRQ